MRHALILAIGLGALGVSAPARAENPACAKIEEPLAYNACLARFGPRAPGVRATADPEGDLGGPGAGDRRRAHGGGELSRRGHGRFHMEFDVGGKHGDSD